MESTQQTEFVFRRLADVWRLAGKDLNGFVWLAVLLPVLVLGLFYVGWSYRREAYTIGRAWASFLAVCRVAVYLLLAWIFLLPALQVWDTSETRSKVVLLLDVSGSMQAKDDLPTDSIPVEKLLSRQDKVIRFLSEPQIAFLKRLQGQNPVTLYRFGSVVDEESRALAVGSEWTQAEWADWLKPPPSRDAATRDDEGEKAKLRKKQDLEALLLNGTNLNEAILGVLNHEAHSMLQGIILVSDGHNTTFAAQTFDDWRSRAERSRVPVFTVAVGEDRTPIAIRITDVQAPDQARPDDKFPVRVEVDGDGLSGQVADVVLEVTKPNGDKMELQPKSRTGEPIRFKAGEPPHAEADFEIDQPTLVGEWKLVARVPRDRRETFAAKDHLSEPVSVNVVKKPIRVLLFAGGPTRDYQFVRNLFVRESDRKRAELSICLQIARPEIVQDVPADRLLKHFPNYLTSPDAPQQSPEERYYNLGQYDLIIAFDPDWTQLSPEQFGLVEKWVGTHAGGLILVGGPVNTYQLARGVNLEKLKTILDLYPVVPDDSRLQGLGIERPTTDPWPLNFPGATNDMEFLRLDEESKNQLAGWNEFFGGRVPGAAQDSGDRRGFYNFYPVKAVKPNATVVATFSDPRARLSDGKEQPYLVTMPYGNGQVIYLGSGETWRLRQHREAFFERFWTKLARFAGSGNLTRTTRHGEISMGAVFRANTDVHVSARLFGTDLRPLPRTEKPKLQIKPPAGVTMPPSVEMHARPGQDFEWEGWFQARFLVPAPGNYEVLLDIPGTGETLSRKFLVKEANPELDNTRPDFTMLRRMATEAAPVLARVSDQAKARIRSAMERTNKLQMKDPAEEKEGLRLCFDLNNAAVIPDCMVAERKTQRSRGPVHDLWDAGPIIRDGDQPVKVSTLLLVIIALLSLEWLTRKLLKLA
jgi:hypothetical protein